MSGPSLNPEYYSYQGVYFKGFLLRTYPIYRDFYGGMMANK
jgi:hypothetical protein